MGLNNYRDVSSTSSDMGAGFQFEFFCESCGRTWRSAFKPYRKGQLSGILQRFMFMLPGRASMASRAVGGLADLGARGARESALANAMTQAETRYTLCPGCAKAVCGDCWHERDGRCNECRTREAAETGTSAAPAAASGPACPNCGIASSGGRFCAECGFDMASTHKSCPGCGVMLARQARFCTDCGHAF